MLRVCIASIFMSNISALLSTTRFKSISRICTARNAFFDQSSLVAVGDYAAEIENAVGTEIYTPIFKAGLFLFLSGIISTLIAAFIISKANTWDELSNEFDRGKESKLIKSALLATPEEKQAIQVKEMEAKSSVLDEVKDLDL